MQFNFHILYDVLPGYNYHHHHHHPPAFHSIFTTAGRGGCQGKGDTVSDSTRLLRQDSQDGSHRKPGLNLSLAGLKPGSELLRDDQFFVTDSY